MPGKVRERSFRSNCKADFQEVEPRIYDRLTEFMRGIESNLLTEFYYYAKG